MPLHRIRTLPPHSSLDQNHTRRCRGGQNQYRKRQGSGSAGHQHMKEFHDGGVNVVLCSDIEGGVPDAHLQMIAHQQTGAQHKKDCRDEMNTEETAEPFSPDHVIQHQKTDRRIQEQHHRIGSGTERETEQDEQHISAILAACPSPAAIREQRKQYERRRHSISPAKSEELIQIIVGDQKDAAQKRNPPASQRGEHSSKVPGKQYDVRKTDGGLAVGSEHLRGTPYQKGVQPVIVRLAGAVQVDQPG